MSYFENSSSKCFSREYGYDSYDIANYACTVIFLAVYLGILITLCIVRKRTGPGKHLIGLPYILALVFKFIQRTTVFLSDTLGACQIINDLPTFYRWSTAQIVFYAISTFLLAVVVIYTLNTMLRKQLGHNPSALRMVLGPVLFVLGSLLLVLVVLEAYLLHYFGSSLYDYGNLPSISIMSNVYVSLAFDGMFLISILGSGSLSIIAARSLGKRHGTSNALTAWISVLILATIGYTIISIIQLSSTLTYGYHRFSPGSLVFMNYFGAFLRAAAFIVIVIIAKNPTWKSANTFPHQHASNCQEEDPVYVGMSQRA